MSLLITFAINLWHRKFVTVDVTAVFVNNQHGIQRGGQDSDKKSLYLKAYTQQRGWQTNFLRKAGQSVMLISCWKSCGTQAQLTASQAAADHAVPAPTKIAMPFYAQIFQIFCYTRRPRGLEIGAQMQFVCIFFHICWKSEFLIYQGSVATCLRWGD